MSLQKTGIAIALLLGLAVLLALPSAAQAQDLGSAVECGSNVNLETATDCAKDTKDANDKAIDKCVQGKSEGTAAEKKEACASETSSGGRIEGLLRTVLNIMSAIIGIIAVIMVIVGGLRYVLSSGDSNSASGAKNTILYALIGLVIAAFAQVLVQFVLERTT